MTPAIIMFCHLLIIGLLETILLYTLVSRFAKPRAHISCWLLCFPSLISSTITLFVGNGIINSVFIILLYLLTTLLFFDGSLKTRFYCFLFFLIIIFFFEAITSILLMLFTEIPIPSLASSQWFLSALMSKIMTFLAIKGLLFVLKGGRPSGISISLSLLIVLSEIIWILYNLIDYLNNNWENKEFQVLANVIIPLLPLSILFVAFMIKADEYETLAVEMRRTKERSNIEKQWYHVIKETNDNFLIYKHDLKQYISTLSMLVRSERNYEALNLLENMGNKMYDITIPEYNKSSLINALLHTKKNTAFEKGISLSIISEPNVDFSFLSDIEILSLMGNLIDNALNSEQTASAREKKVEIKLFESNKKIIFQVSNHGLLNLDEKNKFIRPAKNKPTGHGFGLRSVNTIVQTHKGVFSIISEGDLIIANALFPK